MRRRTARRAAGKQGRCDLWQKSPNAGGSRLTPDGSGPGRVNLVANASDRVNALLESYLLALAGLDQCPDSAPDTVRQRLKANVERAERIFSDGAADGLQRTSPATEIAHLKLGVANERARRVLREGGTIVALVNDLEATTRAALEMLGRPQR